jgi:pimeloyl-ACP methyl ester carboxylesterase
MRNAVRLLRHHGELPNQHPERHRLGARPAGRKPARPESVPERKAPPPRELNTELEVEYRTIHGHRRAFVRAGSGPALLLIHGIGDSSATWLQLIPLLAQHHTVIAPDLLGHGCSDKPRADYSVAAYANAMRDLLSVLDIERATVVGHSLGGGVAMQFAYQYPDRCERLVLVSSGGVSREVHPLLRLAATPTADLLLPLLGSRVTQYSLALLMRLMKAMDTDLGRDADDWMRVCQAFPSVTARSAFVRTLRAVVDWRGQVVTMLDRCYLTRGMPTLLIWGARDPVIPFEHARIVHKAMPGSRLEVFESAGHLPHRSDPKRFLSVLREFIGSTEPASYSPGEWRLLLRRGQRPEPSQLELLADPTLADQWASGT